MLNVESMRSGNISPGVKKHAEAEYRNIFTPRRIVCFQNAILTLLSDQESEKLSISKIAIMYLLWTEMMYGIGISHSQAKKLNISMSYCQFKIFKKALF